MLPAILFFIAFDLFTHNGHLANKSIIDLIAATALIGNYCILLKTKKARLSGIINTIIIGVYFLALLAVDSSGGSSTFWSICFPLAAFFFLGKRRGTIACAAYAVGALLLIYLPNSYNLPLTTFATLFKLSFCIA